MKHLPAQPTPEWHRENMQGIVRRLKRDILAHIALCSLIPIGEDPDSQHPFQAAVNRRIEEYSAIIKDIVCQEEVSYLPLYEHLRDLIRASPGRASTSFDFLPFYRDAFRQFVLRQSNDEIGQLNGWRFHRDGIHLNSRSGPLLADTERDGPYTASDVLDLYLHCGSFETVLAEKTASRSPTDSSTRTLPLPRSLLKSSLNGFGTCAWDWGKHSLPPNCAPPNLLLHVSRTLPQPMNLYL